MLKQVRMMRTLLPLMLMPTLNINLTDRYDQFVGDLVKSGRFRDTSEVMQAGLHLLLQQSLQEREKLELLRTLAHEGFRQIDQGSGIELETPDDLTNFVHRLGERAAATVEARTGG